MQALFCPAPRRPLTRPCRAGFPQQNAKRDKALDKLLELAGRHATAADGVDYHRIELARTASKYHSGELSVNVGGLTTVAEAAAPGSGAGTPKGFYSHGQDQGGGAGTVIAVSLEKP